MTFNQLGPSAKVPVCLTSPDADAPPKRPVTAADEG